MFSTDGPTDPESASVDGSVTVRKRTFLASAFGVGVAAIAGCTGDGAIPDDDSGNGAGRSDEPGDGGEANDGSNDGGDASGHPDLPEVAVPESYVAEEGFTDDESTQETGPIVYEVHGDDMVFYEDGTGDESATYVVDGELYRVSGDQCTMVSDYDSEDADSEDSGFYPGQSYSYERVGTETVDGVDFEVYRRGGSDLHIYIDVETNYVRRLESDAPGGTTTVFHSFEEVDPIEPPDMECQDLAGGE